jgi:D-alanine-D-alanine ligase
MKKLRVLALMHEAMVPPEDAGTLDRAEAPWKMEFDVIENLNGMGHQVEKLGVGSDLGAIRRAIDQFQPHIVFNLLEDFNDVPIYDQNVVSYLELQRVPYTGCNARGLLLARDKAISKKLLVYHRIPVPEFFVFHRGRPVRKPPRAEFPLIVKSLVHESSTGISQASVVQDERLEVFPVWEIFLSRLPEGSWAIATESVKWNPRYQRKHKIETGEARELPPAVIERIQKLAKRIYKNLYLSGYARIDFRMDAQERVYVLEANPNPHLGLGEDFADSAAASGLAYDRLLQRILNFGLSWSPQ